jgi:hypothetical protein
MRVRVIQHHDNFWRVQKRYRFWPFWITVVDDINTFDSAKVIADRLKNPTILELSSQ